MGFVLLNYSFNSTKITIKAPNPVPSVQTAFAQNPPYPIGFWVKKAKILGSRGENMIFRVKYESDASLPAKIDYYQNAAVLYTLQDDGIYPDDIAGDKKFACLKKEDFTKLKAEISARQIAINTQGHVIHFTGHSGEVILSIDIKPFDEVAFDNGGEVEVNALLIDAADCVSEIKPEKSLFITDLSVVEDQSRTYNVYTGVGNPTGAWTFGTLMANIENGTHADGVRGFLKDWVKNWTANQTIQGELVKSRDFVLITFIAPWLKKANNNPSLNVTLQNWETLWNATPQSAIRNTAPFKLTSIVNRLDLRGNSAYTSGLENSGETRFIYTLVNPLTGEVPINPNQTASANQDGIGFIDWRGLNVIFEFGNVQNTSCEARDLAQRWLDLSDNSLPMGSATTNNAYKDSLQSITNLVTLANSRPNKPNGSAIHRIRTNEKLFAPIDPLLEIHLAWEKQDWEFRQFEIDIVTHKLKLVPLTNNPPVPSNFAPNIQEDYLTSVPVSNHSLLDWVYNGHKIQVKRGNFNMPNNLLAVSGLMRREGTQFLGLEPEYWVTKSNTYSTTSPSVEAKQIRQQLSLNTCVGCHAGETKTRFTHVNTLKYGESANYLGATIAGLSGTQDESLYPWGGNDPLQGGGKNNGLTEDLQVGNVINFDIYAEIKNQTFFQNVSSFLTGRRYRSAYDHLNLTPNWQDDNLDDDNTFDQDYPELNDNQMEGLFYVNDPSNNGLQNFPYVDDKKWGYNDLLNRKIKLCQFLLSHCGDGPTSNDPSAIQMITQISFIPFPLASH